MHLPGQPAPVLLEENLGERASHPFLNWRAERNLTPAFKYYKGQSHGMKVSVPQSALAVSSSLLTADKVRPITSTLSSSVLCCYFNTNGSLCPNLDFRPNSSDEMA